MFCFQTLSPGCELENYSFLHFLLWNKNVAVFEGMMSFSAVLDGMGQCVTRAYSAFIDANPGPGTILSTGDTEMNKAWPLPMRNLLSRGDEHANR